MRAVFLCVFTVFSLFLYGEKFCFFCPPDGWVPADPKTLSPLVKIGFLDTKTFGFRASLNLAEEIIDCSLDEYLAAVQKIHVTDHHSSWANLGKIPTKAGEGTLTQIDSNSAWGPVRMLQLVLVHDQKAYILTAAASKKEFPKLVKTFKESLCSLSVTDDLLSRIENEGKRVHLSELKTAYLKDGKEAWENLQNEVLHENKDLGAHWQALVLAETLKERPLVK